MKSIIKEQPAARSLDIGDRLCLNESEAALYIGLSVSYLRQARMGLRAGPAFTKFGKAVRYQRPDLDEFAQRHKSAQPMPAVAAAAV